MEFYRSTRRLVDTTRTYETRAGIEVQSMSGVFYNSHTHGKIPLSETGKRLMHELRVAINDAIQAADYNCEDKVAHARGELALYLSKLEEPKPDWQGRIKAAYSYHGTGVQPQNLPRYGGTLKENLIQGNRANLIMIDDPQAEHNKELDMSKKAVAARKKAAAKESQMRLVGVRFLSGHSLAKVYTYKTKRTAKLHLGQEVVVHNAEGASVAAVVSLDHPMPPGYTLESLVELTAKVAPL
jgi:hypothetical protein